MSRAASGQSVLLTSTLSINRLFKYSVQEPVMRPALRQLPIALLSMAVRRGKNPSWEFRFSQTPTFATTLLRTVT